jgi:hypothetical protein
MRKPYVGLIVQYYYRVQDGPHAAIVTYVHDETWVSLFVIPPGGGTRVVSHAELGVTWKYIDEKPAAADTVATDYPNCIFP